MKKMCRVFILVGLLSVPLIAANTCTGNPETIALTSTNASTKLDISTNQNGTNYYITVDRPGTVEISVTTTNGHLLSTSMTACPSNTAGVASETLTLNANDLDFNVKAYRASGNGNADVTLTLTFVPYANSAGTGLRGEYYNRTSTNGSYNATSITGVPDLTRIDATVDFNWGANSPSSGLIQTDNFQVKWSGYIYVPTAGTWTLYTQSDDGVSLNINGNMLITNWTDHSSATNSASIALHAGYNPVVMQFYEHTGSAVAQLSWSSASLAKQIIPQANLYPAIPVISPRAEFKFDACVFDETLGDVVDTSGNGFDGTSSQTQTTNSEKVLVRSADFSGNSAYDSIALNPAIMNGKSDFSVSFWIKGNSAQDQSLISMANASQFNEALLFLRNGGTTFSPHIKGTTVDITIPDIIDDQWHHLVWKRNGTTGQTCLVIDAATASPYCVTIPQTGPLSVTGLVIGQEQDTVNGGFVQEQDFEGFMDELKFYDSLLSDADIVQIYAYEHSGLTYTGAQTSEIFCSSASCNNYAPQLNINTYNLSTYGGGQIDSKDEFDTVIATYVNDTYRYGSGLIAQINTQGSNNNPFGDDERYLTVIEGFLDVPSEGNYTFMVNGDDAVEVLVDDVVVSSWYAGHASSATPQTNTGIFKGTVTLAQGRHKLVFHHHENTGSDSYELYWKKPGDTDFQIIPTSYLYHCLPYPPRVEYRFDDCDDYNGTVGEVKDSSRNHFDATSYMLNQTQIDAGKFYQSAHFALDALTDYVIIPPSTMNALTDFTIATWIKSTATQDQAIISGAHSGQHNELLLFITSGGTKISPYIKGANTALSFPDVSDGTWHHLVWRRNGTTGRNCITVDGNTTQCTNGTAGALSIQGLVLGQEQDLVLGDYEISQDFEGFMDEFKIYDKYLSDDEIKNVYTNENKTLNYDGSYRTKPFCLYLQQCYADSFDGTSLGDKWSIINKVNYTPQVISNKLVLTDLTGNAATGVTLVGEFPSADNYIQIEFEHNAYGGTGADGVTIALADAAVVNPLIEANATTIAGAYGGSLGYAQRTGVNGFKGGWLGFGFDEYGNFSNPTEGRIGGPGRVVDSISIRGSGSGQSGYAYITGTATLSPQVDNTPQPNGYMYKLSIDTRNAKTMVKVERDTKLGNGYQTLIDWYDATQTATSPEKFKLSLTASTGGANNYHTIDDLRIQATGCGTLGQKETPKTYAFDAWNTDTTHAHIFIGTKIVDQAFDLTIGSLTPSFELQDYNGTVCAHITDENGASLSSWTKLFYANESTKTGNFTVNKASKRAKVRLVWKDNQNLTCPLTAETNSTLSSDYFAIRPKTFEISNPTVAYAGDTFTLDFKALTHNNLPTQDYNETKDGSFAITGQIGKVGCSNGVLTMAPFYFTDGLKLTVDGNYSDVGDVNVTIAERVGFEFASVDTSDTQETNRLINQMTLSLNVKPYELNVTDANFTASTGLSWLYDANVSDMYVRASASVQANNKQHQPLANFIATCYAQDVSLGFFYDVNNTNSNVMLSYEPSVLNANKSIADIDKTVMILASSFTTAKALAEYTFNVDRAYNIPLNPIDIALQEVRVTSVDVAKNENNATSGSTKRFYYGRVKTKDIATDKTTIPHLLHVEVYSTTPLSGFYQNSLNWYSNVLEDGVSQLMDGNFSENRAFVNNQPSTSVSVNGVSPFIDGIAHFTILNPLEEKSAMVHVDIPAWLWYSGVSEYSFALGSTCAMHPCFDYKYTKDKETIGIKSGTFKGSNIGNDYNASYQKSGVKTFR